VVYIIVRIHKINKKEMKLNKILILMLFVFVTSPVFSQIGLKLGPVIGLTTPSSDYSGEVKDFYAGTKYGMSSGVNFGAMGKVQFGPLNGRVSVSYASLSNSGVPDPTHPNTSLEVKNNILMITLGTEFGFGIPFSPVKPYAGIDVLFSTIGGTVNYQGTSDVSTGEKDIKSASRTGLGLAVGSEISFGSTFVLDISLRYNLINLFGKSYDGVANSNNRIDAYTSLNDAADPDYSAGDSKHPIGSSRSISTIQLQLGILFGL